jgi:hypothetical protein
LQPKQTFVAPVLGCKKVDLPQLFVPYYKIDSLVDFEKVDFEKPAPAVVLALAARNQVSCAV